MLTVTAAKLFLEEKELIFEGNISPENTSIASVYQEVLNAIQSLNTVELLLTQDIDSNACLLHSGHAHFKLRLRAGLKLDAAASSIPVVEAPPGFPIKEGRIDVDEGERPSNTLLSSSMRNEGPSVTSNSPSSKINQRLKGLVNK